MASNQPQKPRGTDDEILFLIISRRKQSKRAMGEVVSRFTKSPWKIPSIELLIDYLASMFHCIELMLKLLSEDWRSHDVERMYQKVFGHPHAHSSLLQCIEEGMKNQKYLLEPSDTALTDLIPEIEELFLELKAKLIEKYRTYQIKKEIIISPRSVEYLRKFAGLFHKRPVMPEETVSQGMRAYEAELETIANNMDAHCQNTGGLDFHYDGFSSLLAEL